MFKQSKITSEIDLFKGCSQHFTGKKFKDLTDEKAWYNIFHDEITSQIDEKIFEEIFTRKTGRPNSSIRILVSMIILKEGQDWTDEQLYENCRYNLAIMRALGLTNIDDEVPVPSTYYDFKSKVVDYYDNQGIDLMEAVFRGLTSTQVKKYKINGANVRMDSKLIQSNLCKSSRLFKILQAFQTFYQSLNKSKWQRLKKPRDRELVERLMSKSVVNHVYGMKKDEETKLVRSLGFLLKKLLNIYSPEDSIYYESLQQMYREQYIDVGKKGEDPKPRDGDEMESDSIQSIHDVDAAYRVKGHGRIKQKVSGYSSNITETTEGPLKLITDVQLEKANFSDDKYLEKAIKNTVEITKQSIEKVYTDGGYDSQENRLRFKEHIGKEWHLSKSKGGSEFRYKRQEDGSIIVYDPVEKKWLKATQLDSGKYRICIEGRCHKYRYIDETRVESMLALEEVRPKHIDKGKRANVESTINEVFHILGKKSKYRGLMRHKILATSRSLWVNCRRIARFKVKESWIFEQILTIIKSFRFFFRNRLTLMKLDY